MRFAISTLGCKVNSYESSAITKIFEDAGYEIVSEDDIADIYVINTCTVTNQGDAKSRKKIRSAIKANKDAIIIVMGCYSQTNPSEVALIEGVDIIMGNNEKSMILQKIEEYKKQNKKIIDVKNILRDQIFENLEACEFEHTRAYLKIQDGCNNFCSYCAIPFARGNLRSRPFDQCIEEASKIIQKGYKEIVLTGIHTGAYGKDLGINFSTLVEAILNVKGLERLRISSMEITEITDDFLKLFSSPKLAPHLHLPLQSGSNTILKNMNRKYVTEEYKSIIKKIRQSVPNIAITTDLIVGFPGETEELFQETYDFLKEIEFFMIHVFPYSKRKNTKAEKMPNQVLKEIKHQRVNRVMELNKELMINYTKKFINKELSYIPETYKEGYLNGHTDNYILVKIRGKEDLIGKNIKIKLSGANLVENVGEIQL